MTLARTYQQQAFAALTFCRRFEKIKKTQLQNINSQPIFGHCRLLTTKFWPLTLEIRQLLPPLSASKH